MATVQNLKERAEPLLPSGSHITHAFICQTASNFALFIINWATGITMSWITYRCVVVTDDAIYVLSSPRLWGGAKPTAVVATLPRNTKLGPVSGAWGQFMLLGKRYWVKKRFQGELTAADVEAGL